jgi:hypothetical protein
VTDQQELDALSERVAKELGWSVAPGFFGPVWRKPGDARSYPPPIYASDWSLLPEMLAWLRERGWLLSMMQIGGWHVTGEMVSGSLHCRYPVRAATLPEAVARLVVAVAEREAKEQS